MTDPSIRPKARLPVFRSLQAGRGIAALTVVLYHSEGLLAIPKYWGKQSYFFYFGASGIDFFFVLSGIVILHAHLRDLNKPERLGSYALKRIRRIYPIYWFVLFSLLLVYFVIPSFGKGFERQAGAIFDSVVLLPIFQRETIIPVAWTLQHEIMFYLLFGFLLWNKRWGQLLLGLWMLGSLLSFWLPPGHAFLGVYFAPQHLLFGMGMLGRVLWERLQWKGELLARLGIVGFVGCAIYENMTRPNSWWLPLAYGFSAFLGSLGCMLIEKRRPLKIPGFLMTLGDASYSLYLVHYAVISAAAKVLYRIWERHPTPLAIPFLILVGLAVATGLIVHFYVEVPLLAWMSKRTDPILKETQGMHSH